MIDAPATIEWRVGRMRLLLPLVVHGLAASAAVEVALEWSWAWIVVGSVVGSSIDESLRWRRQRGLVRMLELLPGGLAIDLRKFRARRAWLGPGWTAIWLTDATRRRRLWYVLRDEVADRDHAALRRHVKEFDFA